MVSDQKGHSSRHEGGGSDEIALDGLTLSDDAQLNIGTGSDFVFQFDSANSRFEIVDNVNNSDILRLTNSGSFDIVNRNLDMGSNKIENVDTVDGVNVASHASRHSDGGGDELDAADLSGASGTSGQVLQTDGSAASWVDFQSGSDVSDDGSLVVSAPSDVNYANGLAASDDGDGSVSVDVLGAEIDITRLDGSAGSSGQFLQTDGTNLSFASISTKAFEEVADFSSIPSNPETGKGFTTTDKGELFVEVNN